MHPLFLVSDGLDRPCELDWTMADRPVIRIRRGQVFSAEFAQLLSDLFREVDKARAARELAGTSRHCASRITVSGPEPRAVGVPSHRLAVPEQSVAR